MKEITKGTGESVTAVPLKQMGSGVGGRAPVPEWPAALSSNGEMERISPA